MPFCFWEQLLQLSAAAAALADFKTWNLGWWDGSVSKGAFQSTWQLSSVPRTQILKGKNCLTNCPLISMHIPTHIHTCQCAYTCKHTCTHIQYQSIDQLRKNTKNTWITDSSKSFTPRSKKKLNVGLPWCGLFSDLILFTLALFVFTRQKLKTTGQTTTLVCASIPSNWFRAYLVRDGNLLWLCRPVSSPSSGRGIFSWPGNAGWSHFLFCWGLPPPAPLFHFLLCEQLS